MKTSLNIFLCYNVIGCRPMFYNSYVIIIIAENFFILFLILKNPNTKFRFSESQIPYLAGKIRGIYLLSVIPMCFLLWAARKASLKRLNSFCTVMPLSVFTC